MGFTSLDDLVNQISTNGKYDSVYFNKAIPAAMTAGVWSDSSDAAGYPPLPTYGAADLTFTPTDDTWVEGALQHGGNVSPATKHFTSAGAACIAAVGAPFLIMAYDCVGYVKLSGTNVSTAGSKVVTMAPIGSSGAVVDRYPNGVGLKMFMTAAGAALGANAPTCIVNYLNTSGASRATTTFTSTASAARGSLINTGTAINKYNPFLPLQGNDTGVSDIVNVTWSGTAHASGTVILKLVKPLWTMPVPATGLYSKMDFLASLPSLPRIRDGANIQFLLFNTGATSAGATIMVDFDYAFGG